MSTEAITWVLQHAVGVDKHTGQLVDVPPHLIAVLLGLANHAHADGTAAFPGQPQLAHYARKTDRAVRGDLTKLLELKVIRLGDQRLVDHIPADERPVVYDLAMERGRPGRMRGRNLTTYPQDPGAGSPLPAEPGQEVPQDHDRPEGGDRPEARFRPEADDRKHSSAPEQMDRKPTSAPSTGGRKHSSEPGGSTVPPNRPGTVQTSSSSPPTDPGSLVDKYSRSVAIIRQHLPDVDDDEAAALADWIRTTYQPAPALLGAYVRRMALAGDLAAVLAERRAAAAAGGAPPRPPKRPPSLIALDQRATAVLGEAVHERMAAVRAEIRPSRGRDQPPAGDHDPPAAAATT